MKQKKVLIKRIIRVMKNYKIHLWNLKLQTIIRLYIITECIFSKDIEKRVIAKYLFFSRRLPFFPYSFTKKYKKKEIEVFYDEERYPYVYHNEKRLYMKKEWTKKRCQEYYTSLLCEQDKLSPHRYITTSDRKPNKDDIIADVGAAEGIFALEVVENAKKLYLFEYDTGWYRPLCKTFEPWIDKIEIVQKFVGAEYTDEMTTLDVFFRNKEVTFLKADIEGAEEDMLRGGEITFAKKLKKVLICTYHVPGIQDKIEKFFEKNGFVYRYNPGYVIYIYDKNTFYKPYLRRCLVFGSKK